MVAISLATSEGKHRDETHFTKPAPAQEEVLQPLKNAKPSPIRIGPRPAADCDLKPYLRDPLLAAGHIMGCLLVLM